MVDWNQEVRGLMKEYGGNPEHEDYWANQYKSTGSDFLTSEGFKNMTGKTFAGEIPGHIAPRTPTQEVAPSSPTLADVEPYVPYEAKPYDVKLPEITPKKAPGYLAPAGYTPSNEATVEGRMKGLLASGSPYLESARQRAKEEAATRGLLNTTMAGTAGERAAIESAFPIAAQDAGAFQEAGMTGYRGEIAGATAEQKHGQDVALAGEQAKLSSVLSGQTAEQDAAAAAEAYRTTASLTSLQGYIAENAAAQAAFEAEKTAANKAITDQSLENIKQSGLSDRLETTNKANAAINNADISSAEKGAATTLIANLGNSYSDRLRVVQTDPNLSPEAKTEVIKGLKDQYEQDIKNVSDIYGVEIDWGEPEGGGEAPADRPEGIEPGPTSSKEAIAYMDRTPGAWTAYNEIKAINPKWTINEWARENFDSRKNEEGVYWGE